MKEETILSDLDNGLRSNSFQDKNKSDTGVKGCEPVTMGVGLGAERAGIGKLEIYMDTIDKMEEAFVHQEVVFDDAGNPVDYRFLDVNPAFESLLNMSRADLTGRSIIEVLPEMDPRLLEGLNKTVLSGCSTRIESYWGFIDRHLDIFILRSGYGGVTAIFRDITRQKESDNAFRRSLREKELLLKEIHHRVKNNLSIVASLLNIQGRYLDSEKARNAFSESRNRINSIALIHEKLYRSRDLVGIDFGLYARDLTDALVQSYSTPSGNINISVDVADIDLSVDMTIPLGLIITELVTNSLKYGFDGGGRLKIKIRLQRRRDTLELTVGDSGPGIGDDLDWRNTETLGIQLIQRLTEQLNGTIELLKQKRKGTWFRIIFPENTPIKAI